MNESRDTEAARTNKRERRGEGLEWRDAFSANSANLLLCEGGVTLVDKAPGPEEYPKCNSDDN